MTRRLLLPLVVLILGFAAAPAQASVTVDVRTNENRGILIIVGSAEEGSNLRVTAEKDNAGHTTHLVVHDDHGGASFEPHGPCQQGTTPFTGAKFVRCSAPNLPFVEYQGSPRPDTEDTLVLTNGTGSCLCDGKNGNDRIVGADGADFIQGGTEDDVLRGGPDGDVLEGEGGRDNIDGESGDDVERGGEDDDELVTGPSPDGADTIDGGDGLDLMDYGPRKARVEARLDGAANDGTASIVAVSNERDNISTTVEKVDGGVGGDLFIGN